MTILKVTGTTNTTPGSCVNRTSTCPEYWTVMQDKAHARMVDLVSKKPKLPLKLLQNFDQRAWQIAAVYARFYLEKEDCGKPAMVGRYYWMGLAAFASKTVACALEAWQMQASPDLGKNLVTLAKGNLWLFYDIAPWHWAYSTDADALDSCSASRNAQTLLEPVKQVMHAMPWSAEALPKIGNFKTNRYVTEAFAKVKEIEKLDPKLKKKERAAAQLAQLLAIADHEQREVLQPLIYNDPWFTPWLSLQRSCLLSWIAPDLELVFAAACTTKEEQLKSKAPAGTVLENVESRMNWIKLAAAQYHKLMQDKAFLGSKAYMEGQIKAIAG